MSSRLCPDEARPSKLSIPARRRLQQSAAKQSSHINGAPEFRTKWRSTSQPNQEHCIKLACAGGWPEGSLYSREKHIRSGLVSLLQTEARQEVHLSAAQGQINTGEVNVLQISVLTAVIHKHHPTNLNHLRQICSEECGRITPKAGAYCPQETERCYYSRRWRPRVPKCFIISGKHHFSPFHFL